MKFNVYHSLFFILSSVFLLQSNISEAQYCTTNLYAQGCSDDDYIDDFYLASIQQLGTGCTSGNAGYADYTSLSTDLQQGQTYTMIFSVGWVDDYINAWIDFNDNGVFEPSELILPSFKCNNRFQDYSMNITIPATAKLGPHRMRVRDVNNISNADPCASYIYGEVHDYTVRITAGLPMTYQYSTTFQPFNLTASPGTDDVKILQIKIMTPGFANPFSVTSFAYNSNGTTNYGNDVSQVRIYYSGTDSDFSNSRPFGHSSLSAGSIAGAQILSPGANYFWIAFDVPSTAASNDHLDAECTSITMSGSVGNKIPTITAPTGFATVNTYCTGDYINPCTSDDFINSFTINTLSNRNSGCNGQAFNYILYTAVDSFTTPLAIGRSYPVTLQSGPDFGEGFGVWIDFNNNGSFSDPGEFVFATSKADTLPFTGFIAIPSNYSFEGFHRMRVRCIYDSTLKASDACSVLTYGETEDYTVNIVSDQLCTGMPNAGTVSSDVNHFCGTGNAATLTVTGYSTGDGVTIQWQQSSDDLNWSDIFGANSGTFITDPLNQTMHFRVKASCSGSGLSSYSNEVTIQVVVADLPSANGDSMCGAGSLQLTATGSGVLKWYDAQTGGNLLGTGSPFITPPINFTTTYWVENNVSGCASPRVGVVALIYQPNIGVTTDRSAVCKGQTITLTAKNSGSGTFSYQWIPVLPGMQPADGKSAIVSVPLSSTTDFTVTATEVNHECDTSISVTVQANPYPEVSFSGLDTMYTINSIPDVLVGTPSGGVFSGAGVTGNVFNPIDAGIGGPYHIVYSYTDLNGCTATDTLTTIVRQFGIGINSPASSMHYSLFPNPANGDFTITIKDPGVHSMNLSVMSELGQIMLYQPMNNVNGEISRTFDVHGWAKGTYMIMITSGDQVVRSKLIVQ